MIFHPRASLTGRTYFVGCGGDLNTNFGAVTSPGYDTGYNDLYDCQWKITVTPGKRVYFRFTDFSLPSNALCRATDFVEVISSSM